MDLKFLEYSAHSFSFSALHESLKQYRDSIVKADEVNRLKNRLSGLGVNLADPSVPVPAVAQLDVVALHVAEAVEEANHKHCYTFLRKRLRMAYRAFKRIDKKRRLLCLLFHLVMFVMEVLFRPFV